MNTRAMTRGLGLAAAVAVVASALAVPAASAAPQQAPERAAVSAKQKPKAKPEDFNGDGYRDVVVSATGANVEDVLNGGYVAVLYGSKSGTLPGKKQIIHQDTPGVPSTAEEGDGFGYRPVSGDLDRDGYTDLVVGANDEDLGAFKDAGTLSVVWGGPKGLSGGATLWEGKQEEGRVGFSTAVADFDGDGDADVVTTDKGAKELRMLSGPFKRNGAPAATSVAVKEEIQGEDRVYLWEVVAGDVNGDGRADLVHTRHGGAAGNHSAEVRLSTGKGFGAPKPLFLKGLGARSLAVGDTNKDAYADIVVGRPYDGYTDKPSEKGGQITWIPGSKSGAATSQARTFNQDSPGVPGASEGSTGPTGNDEFGTSVSIGDVDGDGYGDVAVGVPEEDLDGVENAGAVVLMRGAKGGLSGKGAKVFSQNTPGVPGAAERYDKFGGSVRIVDVNKDKKGELLVTAIGEDYYAGGVTAFKGASSGVSLKGARTFTQDAIGLYANAYDSFGGSFSR